MINAKRKGQVSGSKGQVPAFAGNKKQITTTKKVVADVNAIVRQKKTTSMAAGKTRLPMAGGTKTVYAEDSTGGLQSPFTETARTVKEHSDGDHTYRVAVVSSLTDSSGVEFEIDWLDPDSSAITLIS